MSQNQDRKLLKNMNFPRSITSNNQLNTARAGKGSPLRQKNPYKILSPKVKSNTTSTSAIRGKSGLRQDEEPSYHKLKPKKQSGSRSRKDSTLSNYKDTIDNDDYSEAGLSYKSGSTSKLSLKRKNSVKPPQNSSQISGLVENLLTHITDKYQKKDKADLTSAIYSKIEKKDMVDDINSLAKMIIKLDKYMKSEQKSSQKELTDLKMQLSEQKVQNVQDSKLSKTFAEQLDDMTARYEDTFHQLDYTRNIVKDLQQSMQHKTEVFQQEKQQLMIQFEKDQNQMLDQESRQLYDQIDKLKQENIQLQEMVGDSRQMSEQIDELNQKLKTQTELLQAHRNEIQMARKNEKQMKILNSQLQSDLNDSKNQLTEQQNRSNVHVNELKHTLTNLEDAIKQKYDKKLQLIEREYKVKYGQQSQQTQSQMVNPEISISGYNNHSVSQQQQLNQNNHLADQTILNELDIANKKKIHQLEYELSKSQDELKEKTEEYQEMQSKYEQKLMKKDELCNKQIDQLEKMVKELQQDLIHCKKDLEQKQDKLDYIQRQNMIDGVDDSEADDDENDKLNGNFKAAFLSSQKDRKEKNGVADRNRQLDDLTNQVRTKEEEIQILWNVIKEINKAKNAQISVSQLQQFVKDNISWYSSPQTKREYEI